MPTVSYYLPCDCPCRPFLVGDLPFGCYESSPQEAVKNAVRIMKEGNMDAVKLEGGSSVMAATLDRHPGVTESRCTLSAACSEDAASGPQQQAICMEDSFCCKGTQHGQASPLLQVADPTEQRLSVLWWSLALQ